ncbi:MAG: glycosyl transferase family 4 [Tahibacter sp.]
MSVFGLPLAAAVISAGLTMLAIEYAHRREMLDLPGGRRVHRVATPRGGGAAIVLAVLLCVLVPAAWWWPLSGAVLVAGGLILVAGSGWWDDHQPLGVLPRLATQIPAALALAALVSHTVRIESPLLGAAVFVCVVPSTVWSINLHNFMDGINGLLTSQATWTFALLALLAGIAGELRYMVLLLTTAAACLAFLPFNFPRARIFLGDVGSASLGYLIAVVIWLGACVDPRLIWIGLLLGSAFVIDASLTLLHRFRSGRRWYSSHREHLYQWLVRRNRSHSRVVGLYLAWNLLLVTPLAIASFVSRNPVVPALSTAFVYSLGTLLWRRARIHLLSEVRSRG